MIDYQLFKALEQEVVEGRVSAADFGDYRLYKYTMDTHMSSGWNKWNRQARGLIIHVPSKKVVCRPLNKFFNLDELDETKFENLPLTQPFILQEKLDGSCCSTVAYGPLFQCATPGSMTSDQAIWATNWLKEHLKHITAESLKGQHTNGPTLEGRFKEYAHYWTFIFEAIYPENLNVVTYGDRSELVLLAIKDLDGTEWHPNRVDEIAQQFSFTRPRIFNYSLDRDLINKVPKDEEGYVAFWPELGLRVKIKGETYVQLHRIKSMFSEKGVCECLAEGRYGDLFRILPPHLAKECDDIASLLRTKFYALKHTAEDTFIAVKDLPSRKEQALKIQAISKQEIWGIVFTMLDAATKGITQDIIDRMIWRQIYRSLEGQGKHV